ncbi:MAG: hypothetical protein HZB98_12255 [Bacteroidia bacterium]|nr:hypothetical protein [Bacteroidia bacterium]
MEIKKISIYVAAIMFCFMQSIVAQDTLSVEKPVKQERKAKKEKTTVLDVSNDTLPIVVKPVVKRKGDTMKASMMSVVFPGGGLKKL